MPDLKQNEIEKYKMEIEDFIQLKKDQRPNKQPVELNVRHSYSAIQYSEFNKEHYNIWIDLENRLLMNT